MEITMGGVAVAYVQADEIDQFEEHSKVVVGRIRQKILSSEAGACGFGVTLMSPHWDNEVVFYYQDGGTLHQVHAHELHTDTKTREHFLKALRAMGLKISKNPFG